MSKIYIIDRHLNIDNKMKKIKKKIILRCEDICNISSAGISLMQNIVEQVVAIVFPRKIDSNYQRQGNLFTMTVA